jgi:hypothetical protein
MERPMEALLPATPRSLQPAEMAGIMAVVAARLSLEMRLLLRLLLRKLRVELLRLRRRQRVRPAPAFRLARSAWPNITI